MTNILWLCSWYPNKLKPFDGDFIQRHARAVSLLHKVHVIFIKKDEEGVITKTVKEEIIISGNLTETIIYYKPFKTEMGLIDKIISEVRYRKIYKHALKKYINENGKPPLVHLHIAMKAGIIALWLKKKFGIPFIVSEQWTGYLPQARPNINDEHIVFKKIRRNIFLEAEKITVVSKVLGDAIIKRFPKDTFVVIPNVVDTNIFFVAKKSTSDQTKFIHISTLSYQKNIEQILVALAKLKTNKYNFTCAFFVPKTNELQLLINKYGLQEYTQVYTEVPQKKLSESIQSSDGLILYSHNETFGCVVIEANACGIPAILSDLPVFREYILENKTGIFVKPNDPGALGEALIHFINDRKHFKQEEIAEYTKEHFGYEVVAKQFSEIYKSYTEQ
jgi:glycosyltransferase involved in cell wall biosynthesis